MLKRSIVVLLLLVAAACSVKAQDKIHVYFNHPVDTTVATGVKAVYVNGTMADTLIKYIDNAKYTLDIAVYNYLQGSFSNIATAVNNAYARGVKVRWIYDGSSSNTGVYGLNPAIDTLGSPQGGSYTIMHNKFMVVDANSSTPSDAIVWTGSMNWTSQQIATDYNNVIVVQDAALAQAYRAEFNMMWGDTGIAPNLANSKFGSHKTNLGLHNFTIDGKHVELYFSPSDGTNSHIQSTIATAGKDLYFAMYTFTDASDASLIVGRKNNGVYVAGIDDSYSNSYDPYDIFTAGLGSNFIVYSGTGIYHNKYMIVDPSDVCSDPLVLTGSHNWSISADTHNDENILIIHDAAIANQYYQSFHSNFTTFGGALVPQTGCPTAVSELATAPLVAITPNPAVGNTVISYTLTKEEYIAMRITDMMGRQYPVPVQAGMQSSGSHSYSVSLPSAGVYTFTLSIGDRVLTQKLVKL